MPWFPLKWSLWPVLANNLRGMKNQSPEATSAADCTIFSLWLLTFYIYIFTLEVNASPAISLSAINLARQRRNSHRSVNGLNYRKKESAALAKIICSASVVSNSPAFKDSPALFKLILHYTIRWLKLELQLNSSPKENWKQICCAGNFEDVLIFLESSVFWYNKWLHERVFKNWLYYFLSDYF